MTAACIGIDPTLWTNADSRSRQTNTFAVQVCARCPICQDCAATAEHLRTKAIRGGGPAKEATEWRPHGIWAGMLYDGTTRSPVRPPQTAAVVPGGEDRPTAVARR